MNSATLIDDVPDLDNGTRLSVRARSWRIALLLGTLAAAMGPLLLVKPIPQDPRYHDFADARPLMGIPNFANVASNAGFALVGLLAFSWLVRARRPPGIVGKFERMAFSAFFAGVFLTAFGSGYYHLDPSNQRLLWDRLPMTVGFMSLLAIVIAERLARTAGVMLFGPLLALGAASAIYWYLSELSVHGDIRWYLLVQFYPIVAIPLMCLLFPTSYTRTGDLFIAIGLYVVAKLLETADRVLFLAGSFVSGHTLKHLVSAGATLWLLRMFALRKPISPLSLPPNPKDFIWGNARS